MFWVSTLPAYLTLVRFDNVFRSKTHKKLEERFLIGRNWTKRANFRGSPLVQATHHTKTEKQTINSTCVSWIWEAGRKERARD